MKEYLYYVTVVCSEMTVQTNVTYHLLPDSDELEEDIEDILLELASNKIALYYGFSLYHLATDAFYELAEIQ